ncbi:MAG TPA: DUF4118 domain-containing protein, partial [Thermodesulfobacteriota bacterium]|nr:DUF4118 domain-containing protein [Thermodesulfobacteriota bacterium]
MIKTQLSSEADSPAAHPADHRLLVCLGPGLGGQNLIQTAWQIAAAKNAEWFVLHVDTPAHDSGDGKSNVAQALVLAEELGAKTFKIYGLNILDEIISFVRQHEIRTVCLGRSRKNRRFSWFSKSLADKLLLHLGVTDLYLLTRKTEKSIMPRPHHVARWKILRDYLLAAGGVALCTGLNLLVFPYLPLNIQVMFYLLTVVIIATLSERGPTIFASITSVLAFAFFFVPHYNSFRVANTEFFITLVVMI